MKHMLDSIILRCKKNRISTTEVADALGKRGVLSGVLPLASDEYRVGKIKCLYAVNGSNYWVHKQADDVHEGDIVLILTENCSDRAIIGDIIAKYLLLYRGAAAIIVDGAVRDAARLKREGYSIWCSGITPLGCVNNNTGDVSDELRSKAISQFEGGVAVCDAGGVTIIPPDELNEHMYGLLDHIEAQEDVWSFCLDTLKWNTFDIVCKKKYKYDPSIPPLIIEKLRKIEEDVGGE